MTAAPARSPANPSPPAAAAGLAAVRALVGQGRRREANRALAALEPSLSGDAAALQAAGEIYLHNAQFAEAARCYRRAAERAPRDPHALYNLAAALVAIGELAEAERLFAAVLALDPDDADAWWNLAGLRRWTATDNHVAELEAAVTRARHPAAEVALCYALAKELEDLVEAPAAFAWLKRGAGRRRGLLSYRVEADLETMALIAEVFDAGRLAAAPAPDPAPGPIFVLGLPRSGTTLVDRILSAHSQVVSLGEISDFALALTRLLQGAGDKADLVRRSGDMDHAALGRAYLASLAEHDPGRPFAIDKTPANYLYIGLIALALPNARIVHVRRAPMDVGYALYKTLFRTGCPYSYDLGDIGRYLGAQARLMAHWRKALPGRMIEIDYEALVEDQEAESRRLLAAVGLDWAPACLDFHANPAPAATASAAQVRQPIYRDSVGLWRRYAAELEPLAAVLRTEGVL